jgi:Family of unknown function (DUF6187)
MPDEYDTVFSLPSVDEDPDTELGVLLMGFAPERLLAGLGVAAAGDDDPAAATLLVDQLRHGARLDLTMAAAFTAGATRWRGARPYLEAADPDPGLRSAALRRLWAAALTAVGNAGLTLGHAERVYLAACWLRRAEIDRAVEDDRGTPELTD